MNYSGNLTITSQRQIKIILDRFPGDYVRGWKVGITLHVNIAQNFYNEVMAAADPNFDPSKIPFTRPNWAGDPPDAVALP
jgi:hypothetical protein